MYPVFKDEIDEQSSYYLSSPYGLLIWYKSKILTHLFLYII